MSKHTPGPWVVWQLAPDSDPEQSEIITTADGEDEVCGVVYKPEDARLIAAAPELLDALLAIRDHMDDNPDRPYRLLPTAIARQCDNALAKATVQ